MDDIESSRYHLTDSKKLAGASSGKLGLFYNLEPRIEQALRFLDSIRSRSGGYAARNPGDSPSVATTAMVCIARKTAGVISNPVDQKTQEDVDFLLSRFDIATQSWKIFNGISSAWSTSLCIWSLSILGNGNEPCVKSALDKLLSVQCSGGWGVTPENNNEILISFIATKSLIVYYSNVNTNQKIKDALKQSAEYFKRCLDENINDLNVTDCALALQGLDDIYSSRIINPTELKPWRNKALIRLHELISNQRYLDPTRIIHKVGSGEWHICHFHPAIMPIIYRHKGNDLDIYELLNWFINSFEIESDCGKWKHFTNGDSTYTTALAVYAICDLFNRINIIDFFGIMYHKILDSEEENRKLREDFKHRVIQLILDNKMAASISNFAGAINPIIYLGGIFIIIAGIVWRDFLEQLIIWIINRFL